MGVLILCFLRSAKPKEETVQLVGGETLSDCVQSFLMAIVGLELMFRSMSEY